MVEVNFATALSRFYPSLKPESIEANTVKELVAKLDGLYDNLSQYIVDDAGQLRKHVNIFVNNEMISDRKGLTDVLSHSDKVYFMQALSGG
ncbi:MAG: MoaD/ThiS family protein [Planctomycetota bacterium]|nr:MoaD/ThiS family protein [Planctomycetota bacterium]